MDLNYWYLVIGLVVSLLILVGYIKGWFVKFYKFLIKRKDGPLLDIPNKTIIPILKSRDDAASWQYGGNKGKNLIMFNMRFIVSNITKYNVLISYAILKKYKLKGHVSVEDLDLRTYGNNPIPSANTANADAMFILTTDEIPTSEKIISDVYIFDQFDNKHKMKKVEFINREYEGQTARRKEKDR